MAAALGDAENPVFYLEIPPSLFATVVQGLARVDLVARGQRAVVEKPFGHDLRSARALAADLHKFVGVPNVAAATSAQSRHAVRLQRSAR